MRSCAQLEVFICKVLQCCYALTARAGKEDSGKTADRGVVSLSVVSNQDG